MVDVGERVVCRGEVVEDYMCRSVVLVGKMFYQRQDAVTSAEAAARLVKVEVTVIQSGFPNTFLGGRFERLGDEQMKGHCLAFLKI